MKVMPKSRIMASYRQQAIANRQAIEAGASGRQMLGPRDHGHRLFKKLLMLADRALAAAGIRPALVAYTGKPRLRRLTAFDPMLPKALWGLRILHLTDLHLELAPQQAAAALTALGREPPFDLVAITGDFRDAKSYDTVAKPLAELLAGLPLTADGRIVATLGNHDSLAALPMLEQLGVTVLINESLPLAGGELKLTAVDDSHFFYDQSAIKAMVHAPAGYPILLAHTPDFYRWGAVAGFRLYLCGHTHGGQICLPGGYPLLLHTIAPFAIVTDPWRQGQMLGFTGRGLGYSRLAIRSFCPPEIAAITLRPAPSGGDSSDVPPPTWLEE